MGRKSNIGGTQRVTHTDQLKPSKGYSAILVAADGDAMNLSWNGERWISDVEDTIIELERNTGYLNTTIQGGDTTETVPRDGAFQVFNIVQSYFTADDYFNYRLFFPSESNLKWLEVKKWILAGLNLAGRLTADVSDTGSVADVPYIGPGINSLSVREFLIAADTYATNELDYINWIAAD